MAAAPETKLAPLERAAKTRWLKDAIHVHYGRCDECGKIRDGDGKPLLVARQPRARKFYCLPCFDQVDIADDDRRANA